MTLFNAQAWLVEFIPASIAGDTAGLHELRACIFEGTLGMVKAGGLPDEEPVYPHSQRGKMRSNE